VDFAQVDTLLAEWGEPPYRRRQVYEAAARGLAEGYDEMTALPLALRRRLEQAEPLRELQTAEVQRSADGTIKARLQTRDACRLARFHIPHFAVGHKAAGAVVSAD